MFKSQKHVFWQALILTLLIFSIGLIFGVILENWRISNVNSIFERSDIDLMDVKLQGEIYSMNQFNCDRAIKENINFADRIFEEAKDFDRIDEAGILKKDELAVKHKKFDILRAALYVNSVRIKEKCGDKYHDVLYLYRYNDPDIEVMARQNVLSKLLSELKDEYGSKVLLIPIAGDNNVSSINLIMDNYDINEDELPVVLLNGEKIFDGLVKLEELKDAIDEYDRDKSNQ